MKSNVKWLVKTALFLALLVVLQAVTRPFGTLITGTVVNFVLITASLTVGLSAGLVVAIVSPFLALLLQIVPLPIYIVPVVALGNAVIVLVYSLILKKATSKKGGAKYGLWVTAIVVGAVLKFAALYAGVNWIVVPIVTAAKGVVKAPAAIFSTQQMVTATLGGILALLIVPAIMKAIKK